MPSQRVGRRLRGKLWSWITTPPTIRVCRRVAAGALPGTASLLFEPRQGNSFGLNTGIAATRATIIAFTDDDVRVTEEWLHEGCAPMLSNPAIDYTGGPVRPIWEAPPPPWVDQTRADLWGTLAILDYGPTSFVFEERKRVPLGANMAVRRTLFDRVGNLTPTSAGYAVRSVARHRPSFSADHATLAPVACMFRRWPSNITSLRHV